MTAATLSKRTSPCLSPVEEHKVQAPAPLPSIFGTQAWALSPAGKSRAGVCPMNTFVRSSLALIYCVAVHCVLCCCTPVSVSCMLVLSSLSSHKPLMKSARCRWHPLSVSQLEVSLVLLHLSYANTFHVYAFAPRPHSNFLLWGGYLIVPHECLIPHSHYRQWCHALSGTCPYLALCPMV